MLLHSSKQLQLLDHRINFFCLFDSSIFPLKFLSFSSFFFHSLSLSLSLSFSLSLSLSLSLSHSLSVTVTLSLSLSIPLSVSISHTRTIFSVKQRYSHNGRGIARFYLFSIYRNNDVTGSFSVRNNKRHFISSQTYDCIVLSISQSF